MANTTDFITAVYDELAKLIGQGAGSGSFMQMAWPGYSLNPADFRRPDAPGGPYDPEAAKQAFSHLANIVPAFSPARFENSGFEVDDLYEIVLTSAIPTGATVDNVAVNPIYRLFSDAQYELMQARRGAQDDPNSFYYPCTATPSNWYDETTTQGWTTISLNQSDVKPATPATAAKIGGLDLTRVWRLKPSVADTAALRSRLLKQAVATPVLKRALNLPAPAMPAPAAAPTLLRRTLKPAVGIHKPSVGVMPGASIPVSNALFSRAAAPTSVLKRKLLDVKHIDPLRRDLGIASLAQRLALKTTIDHDLPARPPSPATDGYSISFKMCRVNIDRPWLKLALLSTKNWWMFDTPRGEYSTGAADSNPGMFPLLTTSFIVIRDLKITANWSAEDRNNLGNAAAFGCFDLRDATVNNNTLEVRGMQIIAWISRLMPTLPPLAPPA